MKIKLIIASIIPTIYFLLGSILVQAQNIILPDSLYSKVLMEQRQIKVILPKKYNPDGKDRYDVLYVLDGEWNTSLSEKVYEFLEYAKFIPMNMIIISVPNYYKDEINMRDRDFTPTSSMDMPISGGADNFLLFLQDELIPLVNKKYRTNSENNILYGTSLGGLFAIYAYLRAPTLFKSYLTVEPSLWWDKEYINRIAPEKLADKKGLKNTLWISSRDGGAQVGMGISAFDSLLKRNAPDGLLWKVAGYANETHFSAIWKGIYDGLKFTYVKSQTDETVTNRANTTDEFRVESGKHIKFSRLDSFLRTQMDTNEIPGLSFALINDGQIVYYRTLGVTNVETNQRVSYGTVFDGASMTKTPFALLVMKLAEKGILDLDQPLYTYLPFPDIAQDERYQLITARMVQSHTTGFPNWRFFNKDRKLDLKFTPGTQYQYSGEGYEYLAIVIAHLMGIKKNDLQALFNEIIATPFGMDTTYFTWNDWVAEHQATGHVDGKIKVGYGIKPSNPNFYASYSMQSEAKNYARFLIGMMNEELLKKESYDEMLKPQPNANRSASEQWGLGIGIRHSEYGDEFFHGGFNLSFSSEFMFNKKQKFGYVFFTNSNKASALNKNLLEFLQSGEE